MIASTICIVALFAVGIWLVVRPDSREIRLVVLPLDNRGPADQQWFADGVSSEITDRLSDIYGLAVIAPYSAIQCKKKEMGTKEIAGELDVDYILVGTVECENPMDPNSALRTDLRLIDTSNDTQIWSKSFEDNRGGLFDLQQQVAEHLDLILLDQDRTWSGYIPTKSAEAHNLVLQAKAIQAADDYHKAIQLYESALELDPDYVAALSGLAWAHTEVYWQRDRSPERLDQAWMAANKAFALLPDHPFVRLVMARYHYQGHLNYERALEHLNAACNLHPNHAAVLLWTGFVQSAFALLGGQKSAVTTSERRL